MATVVGWIIGQVLGMDLIDVREYPDKVTYIYRSVGLTASESIQKLKAKIMSILSAPVDLPIDVRIYPVKRGAVFKGYRIEVDVPARPFELR